MIKDLALLCLAFVPVILIVIVFWKDKVHGLALLWLILPYLVVKNISGFYTPLDRIIVPVLFFLWLALYARKDLARLFHDRYWFDAVILVFIVVVSVISLFHLDDLGSFYQSVDFAANLTAYYLVRSVNIQADCIRQLSWWTVLSSFALGTAGLVSFFWQFLYSSDFLGRLAFMQDWSRWFAIVTMAPGRGEELIRLASVSNLMAWFDFGVLVRASGFYADPHFYATVLAFLLPCVILSVYLLHGWQRKVACSATILLFICLLLTFSKADYVAALVAIGVMAALLLFKRRLFFAGFIIACWLLFAACAGVVLLHLDRTALETTTNGRIETWQQSVSEAEHAHKNKQQLDLANGQRQSSPLSRLSWATGIGFGNASEDLAGDTNHVVRYSVHNSYLEMLVELGPVAFALLILLCASAIFFLGWGYWRHTYDRPEMEMMLLYSLAVLIWIMIESLFDTQLFVPKVVIGLSLLLGTSISLLVTKHPIEVIHE